VLTEGGEKSGDVLIRHRSLADMRFLWMLCSVMSFWGVAEVVVWCGVWELVLLECRSDLFAFFWGMARGEGQMSVFVIGGRAGCTAKFLGCKFQHPNTTSRFKYDLEKLCNLNAYTQEAGNNIQSFNPYEFGLFRVEN
jgi:hypothetical protein